MSKSWCFTINNFDEKDIATLKTANYSYLIYGEEVGSWGTPHLQGYIIFRESMSLKKCKLVNEYAHWEIRRGTHEEAMNYCKKDGKFFEDDQRRQGERTDLAGLIPLSDLELVQRHPREFIKYNRGIRTAREVLARHEAQKFRTLSVTVITGDAGMGKTRYVYDTHGFEAVFKLDNANNIWWDGYEGQDILLIDDFYGWIKYGMLLNILDGYPLRLDVKGSFTWAAWTKVYITSNREPDMWYAQGLTPALERRINNKLKFEKGSEVVG